MVAANLARGRGNRRVDPRIAGHSWVQETFDPDRAKGFFKPAESPVLQAARNSITAQEFLAFARFPLAKVESTSTGTRVTIRDMRLALGGAEPAVMGVIELNAEMKIMREMLQFETAEAPRTAAHDATRAN